VKLALFFISSTEQKTWSSGEGLKTHSLKTLVVTQHSWGKWTRRKRKSSSTPAGWTGNLFCQGHGQDLGPNTCLSLRLNQIIRELPPTSPLITTWKTSYLVSKSGIQLWEL
jgi:hypothetical protein